MQSGIDEKKGRVLTFLFPFCFFKHEKPVLGGEGHEFWFELSQFEMSELPTGDAQCSFEKYGSRALEKGPAEEKYKAEDRE